MTKKSFKAFSRGNERLRLCHPDIIREGFRVIHLDQPDGFTARIQIGTAIPLQNDLVRLIIIHSNLIDAVSLVAHIDRHL